MCKAVEQMQYRTKELTIFQLYQNGDISKDAAARTLNITVKNFTARYNLYISSLAKTSQCVAVN